MANGASYESANWYVIHTHAQQEERAASNLKAWQVETFAPKMRERRYNQLTGRPTFITKPLFPRYIFARFAVNDLLHKINYTRGVNSVVSFGESPTPVEESIIDMIQARVGEDGYVKVGDELQPGDEVVIGEGPLKDFVGVFEHETKTNDRVMILLSTVNYQSRILIDRDKIRKRN